MQKIRLYVVSTRIKDRTLKLMRIAKDYNELIGCVDKCPLEHPEQCTKPWTPPTWITGQRQFLYKSGGSIVTGYTIMIELQGEHDKFIMDLANKTKEQTMSIKICRSIYKCPR